MFICCDHTRSNPQYFQLLFTNSIQFYPLYDRKMGYIVSVGRGQIIYGFQRLYFTTSDVLDNNL